MYFTDLRELAIPLFLDAEILSVSFMYYKTVASLMHDINSNNSPTNLSNLFRKKPQQFIQTHALSSTSYNLHVKTSKLKIHKNSFTLLVSFWRITLEWDTLSY